MRRAMYWCCAQVEPRRERLASHCLGLAGYEIYQPLLRQQRRSRHGSRKITVTAVVPRLLVRVGRARLVGCAVVSRRGSSDHGWFVAGVCS